MQQQAIFCCLAVSYLTTGDFCTFESVLGCRLLSRLVLKQILKYPLAPNLIKQATKKIFHFRFRPHVGPSGPRLFRLTQRCILMLITSL